MHFRLIRNIYVTFTYSIPTSQHFSINTFMQARTYYDEVMRCL